MSTVSKKILVVDDDPVIANLLLTRLSAIGYEVITASDGRQGLDLAKEKVPDLIIADLLMPVMDGSTMAAELKDEPELCDIPVIFLTCMVSESETLETEHHIGGHMFFAKPFDSSELMDTVAKLIK